jgi:hypothetical protein
MLSMAGLLSFAWSTGTLFLLAQEFQQRVLQPSDQAANRKSLGIS